MAVVATYSVFADASAFSQDVLLDPASVPKKAVQVENFSVSGLTTAMKLIVTAPTLEAGLFLIDANVPSADTLQLTFWNTTSNNINPASQTFSVRGF